MVDTDRHTEREREQRHGGDEEQKRYLSFTYTRQQNLLLMLCVFSVCILPLKVCAAGFYLPATLQPAMRGKHWEMNNSPTNE